ALVPAEPRNVDAVLLRGFDQQFALLGRDLAPVDRQGDLVGGRSGVLRFARRHAGTSASAFAARRCMISSLKYLFRLATGDATLGRGGHNVVWLNGAFMKWGEMLSTTSHSISKSDGRA